MSIRKSFVIMLILGAIILIVPAGLAALEWPLWPDSATHKVFGTYGQIQSYYIHSGIDITAPPGTHVFSLESGYVKAVINLYDTEHTWRIIIADSANDSWTEGWLYAHLSEWSIPFNEGDYVNAGDYIGYLYNMPWDNPQLHLSRIAFGGDSTTWANGFNDWIFIANPLDFLDPEPDNDFPVIEKAWGDQLFAFCVNNVVSYFPEGSPLSGCVDIICRAYDYYHYYLWTVNPYKFEYKIEGDSSIPWFTAIEFNETVGSYNTFMDEFRNVVYQDDQYCNTEQYGIDSCPCFYNLTNSNGDGITEYSDRDLCWETVYFPNGDYMIHVRVSDHYGNAVADSMTVTVANFFELSGTVSLSNSPPDASGTIVTIIPDGPSDTTDVDGSYSITSIPSGSHEIQFQHIGYYSDDSSVVFYADQGMDITLKHWFTCGDVDNNDLVNILDVTFMIAFLYKGGLAPEIYEACDVNADGAVNILDVTYLIAYLYKGGPAPVCL